MSPFQLISANCWLSDNICDYHFVSQGKTTIPGVDDAEEMGFADVSCRQSIVYQAIGDSGVELCDEHKR